MQCRECKGSLKQVGATGRGIDLIVYYQCSECGNITEEVIPYGNESNNEKFKKRIRKG